MTTAKQNRKALHKNFLLTTNRKLVKSALTQMGKSDTRGKRKKKVVKKVGGVIKAVKPIPSFSFIAVKEVKGDAMNKQKIFRTKHRSEAQSIKDLSKKLNLAPSKIMKAVKNYKQLDGYTIIRFDKKKDKDDFFLKYQSNKARQNQKLTTAGLYSAEGQDISPYKLTFEGDTQNKKWSATQSSYGLKIRDDQPITSINSIVKDALRQRNLNPGDKYRVVIEGKNGKFASTKLLDFAGNDDDEGGFGDFNFYGEVDDSYGWSSSNTTSQVGGMTITSISNPGGAGFLKSEKGVKRSIIQIKNNDDLCLGRCLVVALAIRDNDPKLKQIKMGRNIQTSKTYDLYDNAGIQQEVADLDTIMNFEKYLDCCITIIDGDSFDNVIYPDINSEDYESKEFNIYLYKTGNHYDLIVNTKVAGFFSKNYFCHTCKKCFSSKDKHKCKFKCNICCSTDCDCKELDFKTVVWNNNCNDCHRSFPTAKCCDNHKLTGIKGGKSMCDRVWKCQTCKKLLDREKHPIDDHMCGDFWCMNCNNKVRKDHKCYMMPKKAHEASSNYIFFDFEATQDNPEKRHKVNLGVSEYFDNEENIIHYNNDEFCEWLFDKKHSNFTIIAHNGKGYDYQFIMKWIYTKTSYKPFVIYNGSKIMTFSIKEGLNIRFIDSVNFLAMRLTDFSKTFGITEFKKGYYPHYFNTDANTNYIGPMPPASDFGCDSFKNKDREKFLDWYEDKVNTNYIWDNKKELLEYCISDVKLLKAGMKKLRQLYLDIINIDPLQYTTIAGVCMGIYRHNFIIKDYPKLLVDIEDKKELKEIVRERVFKEKKISIMPYDDQIFVRKSFFGGRTNAISLLYNFKSDEGEVGKYIDITSLYPTVNYYDPYGKGHLTTITSEELNELGNIENYKRGVCNNEYVGFIDCSVTPPDNLYHPVLPEKQQTYTTNERGEKVKDTKKLVFDLKKKRGVWTSMEVIKAVEMGYVIDKLHEIRYYKDGTQTDLFKDYIGLFLKIKQESSGYPDWVKCEEDKDKYIKDYYDLQGIILDKSKIVKNPGLRAVAKLCLNSLWGKFGMRLDMSKTEITDNRATFNKLIFDKKFCDQDINFIDEKRIEIRYKLKDEYIPLHPATNIGIASFTTSHARLRLYKALEKLDKQVLYFDTDSVVYKYNKNNNQHKTFKLGDGLGDWTDELDGNDMEGTFVGGGPKNYSYETTDKKLHTKIKGFNLNFKNSKILNHQGMIDIILNRKKKREDNKLTINSFNIVRKPNKDLVSRFEDKNYYFGYDKRAIQPPDINGNVFTLPFGHKDCQ